VGKIRRGGYVFVSWSGDHDPNHVHVYKDGTLIVKWDLENNCPMRGHATRKIRRLLQELRGEGRL